MSDPRRLWEDEGLGAAEREALRAAREVEVPAEFREQVWGGLVAAIGAGAGAAAGAGAGAGAGLGAGTAAGGAGAAVSSGGASAASSGLAGAGAASTGLAGTGAAGAGGMAASTGGAVVAGSAGVVHATGALSSGAAAVLPLLKMILGGALLGGAALGGAHLAARWTASPKPHSVTAPAPAESLRAASPASAVAAAAGSNAESNGQAQANVDAPAAGVARGAAAAAIHDDASAAREAREESRLVALARRYLRSGHARDALALLDQIRVQYPRGVLVQEREALAIEALATSGQRAAATARGQAFLETWPESPYASRVRALVAPR